MFFHEKIFWQAEALSRHSMTCVAGKGGRIEKPNYSTKQFFLFLNFEDSFEFPRFHVFFVRVALFSNAKAKFDHFRNRRARALLLKQKRVDCQVKGLESDFFFPCSQTLKAATPITPIIIIATIARTNDAC